MKIFDSHIDTATRWLRELEGHLGLDARHDALALHALRAGLHAIRDRLPAEEVLDLGAQLPILIRAFYLEGWRLTPHPRRVRDRAGMLACVSDELGAERRVEPVDVLRAVIRVLEAHVSDGELGDVIGTLPKPLAALWRELSSHAVMSLPAQQPHATRRTGYAR